MARAMARRWAWTARQPQPAFANLSVEAVSHGMDEVAGRGHPCRTLHRGAIDPVAPEADVLRNRSMKQHRILEHDADLPPHLGRVHGADVLTVDAYRTAARLEEAQQQVDEGRFPGAARTNDRRGRSGGHGE